MTLRALGLRFSPNGYSFVLLSGTRAQPMSEQNGTIAVPANSSRNDAVKWLYQEIRDLCSRLSPDVVAIKAIEPMARTRTTAMATRAEFEAIGLLATLHCNVSDCDTRVNATIAKSLGHKGKTRYLRTHDTTPLSGFEELTESEKESALAAWGRLPST